MAVLALRHVGPCSKPCFRLLNSVLTLCLPPPYRLAPLLLQLPERVQQLSAGATSVLFDFDRLSGYQHAPLRHALSAAAGRGKAVPLKPLMHR
jgi:hypothetical protein